MILAAVLAVFVYGMIAAMLGTILPDLSRRFNLTPRQNGNIALAQALGLIVSSTAVGPLMDIEGTKTGLLLGLGLAALALFLLPASTGYRSIMGYLFLLGLGGGSIVAGAFVLAGAVNQGNRTAVLNLVNLFFGLGGMATPFISANVLKRNTTWICYFAGAVSAATLGIHAVTRMPAPTGSIAFQASAIGGLLSSPVFWLLAAILFLYTSAEVGVWNWLARHLIAQGIPEARSLNILSLGFALGILLGRVAVAPVLISVKPELVTLAAGILMAVTSYLALQTRDAKVAGIAVFCAGLAMAPVFPTISGMAANIFTTAQATATGLVQTFGWIGLAVSSGIIGSIAGGDASRLKKALLVLPIFSVLIVAANLVLIVLLR